MRHRIEKVVSVARGGQVALAFILCLLMSACSFIPRTEFTLPDQNLAEIPGIPGARFFADAPASEISQVLHRGELSAAIAREGRFDVLALSGGAYDGAYGAGLLSGWTASGSRPRFTIVTGVSAGALLAPAAFLGPDYDYVMRESFTSGIADVLGSGGGVLNLLGTPDLRRDTLERLIERFVTPSFLAAVAAEHRSGRRLFVLTTNLDAQRAVVWDMGAIAASGQPNALQLFRDVLVASASIPGIFAPTLIEVQANGRRFKELHVDGGATSQVFILPDAFLISGRGAVPGKYPRKVWTVINNHLTPEFEVVEAGLLSTVGRAFSTLIKNSTKTTLIATQRFLGREGFRLTYIDGRFDDALHRAYGEQVKPGFDQAYMRFLFDYAYAKAQSPAAWQNEVPLPDKPRPQNQVAKVPG